MINLSLALYGIPILANTLLGFIVFLNNPKSKTNQYFTGFILNTIIWTITLFMYYQTNDQSIILYIDKLNLTAVSFIVLFLSLFALNFPQTPQENKEVRILTNTLILWTILLSFATIFTPLIVIYEDITVNLGRSTTYGPLHNIYLIHFVALATITIGILGKKYENLQGRPKRQVGFVIWGLLIAIILASMTNIIIPITKDYLEIQELGPLLSMTMTISISYAIIKHRLLDIRMVVARTVSSTITITLIAFFYASYLFVISTIFTRDEMSASQLIIAVILALVIAFTLKFIKQFAEKATEPIFFKKNYHSQELLYRLGKITSSTFDLKNLIKNIINELSNTIGIENVTIILLDKNRRMWKSSLKRYHKIENIPIKNLNNFVLKAKKEHDQILLADDVSDNNLKKDLKEYNIVALIPLIAKNSTIGVIILDRKQSGEIYTSKDIRIFKVLSSEVSIAIKNALSYEVIKRFNLTLEEKIKKATAKLKEANKELKELDVLKDEFVSIASHELRTPMTAIKSYLWLVLNKSKNIQKKDQEYLNVAYNATERLIALVNDMLVISRIEGKRLNLDMQKINIIDSAHQVIKELGISAREKQIELSLKTDNKEVYVYGDSNKLGEVIQNLIGNALKFTPKKGKIELNISMFKDNAIIKVIDTGPGIPKEDIQRLFIKFSKISYAYKNTPNIKGTGLGLYISKQIIGLHNGNISVKSKIGKGTIFTVTIPIFKE